MQVLDSLIDGPLQLSNRREGDELIGMIVRYLRTGDEPSPRTDAQRMALAMVRPVLVKSRARSEAGSKGGSKTQSKRGSKQERVEQTEMATKETSKAGSDIYSSTSFPTPESPSEEGVQGEEADGIPYGAIVAGLNAAAGTSYRPTSRKTRQLIRARWSEGYRLDDFEAVVETMSARWGGDAKMAAYLRPETLFGTKFESYRELARTRPGRGASDDDDEYSRL